MYFHLDEDFEAFAASTTHYNHSRVKIDLPETSAAKEAPPRKPKATAPVKIQKSAADVCRALSLYDL